MNQKKILWISVIISLVFSAVIVTAYIISRDRPLGESYKEATEYGGEFTLQGQSGEISLSDFKGKIVIIYFGYIQCKLACPVSLMKIKNSLNSLTEQELSQIQSIFISIDAARDKPKAAEIFAKNYHKNLIGLVDTPESIQQLVNQYGAYLDKDDLEGGSITYSVDHSSRFYLIDREGNIVTTMSYSTTPSELTAKIRQLINEPK